MLMGRKTAPADEFSFSPRSFCPLYPEPRRTSDDRSAIPDEFAPPVQPANHPDNARADPAVRRAVARSRHAQKRSAGLKKPRSSKGRPVSDAAPIEP